MMDSDDIYLCHKCGKIFYKLSTLESHSRWKHMEKTNEFMCDQCGRTFQKKYNLIKHLESAVHEISESVNCALCDYKALNRKLMCEHYQNFHGVLLKESNVYFKTADEFFLWKSDFENKTRSRFVKMSSSRKRKNGFMRSTYFCHRDGNFIPKGKNLRHMKVKGSNKINAHCPAKMEVEIGERICIVSYIDIHLGHDLDITRMNLDPADKAFIAKRLALKVPFEQILDEINNSRRDGELKRVNLLTRKDLWNIVDTFKINPKNVVYSRNRVRRKKKMEGLRKEPKRNPVYLKIFNQDSSNSLDESKIIYDVKDEEQYTGSQVISVKQENDENLIYCPVILKDENDQYVQEYAVLPADESDEDVGTCLIINSKGELESISGHKIIYTEQGNVEICETLDMDESEMTVDNLTQTSIINENPSLKNEEQGNAICDDALMNEASMCSKIYQKDNKICEIKTSQKEIDADENSNTTISKNRDFENSAHENSFEQTNVKEEIENNTGILYISDENSEAFNGQTYLVPVEEGILEDASSQYEVTIANYDGENENEYVIISTEDEDVNECTIISSENSVYESADCTIPVETVTVEEVEDNSHQESVGKELTNGLSVCGEYAVSSEGKEPKWNVKREQVLHKLLNVHNMISNEQQLKVFSKNISSLENVLKSLTNSQNQVLQNCDQESES